MSDDYLVVPKKSQHPLDTRHETFANFVAHHVNQFRDELIRGCERIAVHRELNLKMEVEKAHKQNEELRRKIRSVSRSHNAETTRLTDAVPDENRDAEFACTDEGRSSLPSSSNGLNVAYVASPYVVSIDGESTQAVEQQHVDDVEVSVASSQVVLMDREPKESVGQQHDAEKPVSLDNHPAISIESADQEGQIHDHFELWPEWVTAEAEAQQSKSPEGKDSQMVDDSQLEIEWLRGHDVLNIPLAGHVPLTGTFPPDSCFGMTWDFIGVPILLYDLVTLPLQVFWTNEGPMGTALTLGITFYWTADIFLRLLVFGFYKSPLEVELRRSRIMLHYLQRSLLFDLLVVVPDWISLFANAPRNLALLRVFRLMRFMRLLRMRKLRETSRQFQDRLDSESFSIYMNIMWNMLVIIGCCHYIACFWYWIGQLEFENHSHWVEEFRIENASWEYQYFTSLHWALCQFTPGGMRVQPVNTLERLVAIVVLISGMVFFSLFVSSITQERMRLKGLTQKMDRDNWMLRRYMKQQQVSRGLSARAVKYVDTFVAPMMMRVQRKDVALLDCLSRPLQLEVQSEIWFHTLLVHPFLGSLKEKSHTMASNVFSDVVAELSLAKNDLLFEVGQVSHEMFFVSHGVVGYLHTGTNNVAQISELCCEQVIWIPWIHKGTSRAVEESYLLSVDSAKFRTEVLEYRERAYVRDCAQAYVEDLNDCVAAGVVIDDLTRMDHQNAKFVRAFQADVVANAPGQLPE